MCDSERFRRAMLNDHIGKNITVVLDASQNNVFKGVLGLQAVTGVEDECYVIVSDRGLVQQGYQKVAIPETKIYFTAADLKYIIVPQETEEEASRKLQAANISISLASPSFREPQ